MKNRMTLEQYLSEIMCSGSLSGGDDKHVTPGALYCCENCCERKVDSPGVFLSNEIYKAPCVLRTDTNEICLCGDKLFNKEYDADMAGSLISSGDVKYVFCPGTIGWPRMVAMPKDAYDALDEGDKKDVCWFNE